MKLKEANEEIERLDNDIERLLGEKEILLQKTQPQASDPTKELTQGGERKDKFLNYVVTLEEKQINEQLDYDYARKENLERWLTQELHILGKYNETEKLIRHYKEDVTIIDKYTKRIRELTWEEIGKEVHYSAVWCRKVYRLYKMKRDI